MKILGIGVDVIQNERIKRLINDKSFLKRTFGKNEIRFSKRKTRTFANPLAS